MGSFSAAVELETYSVTNGAKAFIPLCVLRRIPMFVLVVFSHSFQFSFSVPRKNSGYKYSSRRLTSASFPPIESPAKK